jgi:glutamate N-acetyltransferase/amino-acid N-acetyltransferase
MIHVLVSGAPTFSDAQTVAQSIAQSSLVKCAAFGGDPNWGRILAAAGKTFTPFRMLSGPSRGSIAEPRNWNCSGSAIAMQSSC